MVKKLAHAFLIVALFGAVGGHWAVLQTVAWADMLAKNLRTESVGEAITQTFDGEHPCKLCHRIAAGKKAERKAEFSFEAKKFEFVCERSVFVFAAPREFYLSSDFISFTSGLTHRPAVPPPRPESV